MKSVSQIRSLASATLLVLSLLYVPALKADLLSGNETQLEAWLGQGNLTFTNIFTKTAADNFTTLHAAIDGKGPTFMLMDIYGPDSGFYNGLPQLPHQIVGGYNPQAWNSNGAWNLTPNDADRTAFIYNLTNDTIQQQNSIAQAGAGTDWGVYQTYSGASGWDFAFGGGVDLGVRFDLTQGQAYNRSFGGTTDGDEIVIGGPNFPSDTGYSYFTIGAVEFYTFEVAPDTGGGNTVPDAAGTLGLVGVSLLGLVAFRRRLA